MEKKLRGLFQSFGGLVALGLVATLGGCFDRYAVMPNNAQVWIDPDRKLYASPPCLAAGQVTPGFAQEFVYSRAEAYAEGYKPDDVCRNAFGFTERLKPWRRTQRWRDDGSWAF